MPCLRRLYGVECAICSTPVVDTRVHTYDYNIGDGDVPALAFFLSL
jgi:hypothetical protein